MQPRHSGRSGGIKKVFSSITVIPTAAEESKKAFSSITVIPTTAEESKKAFSSITVIPTAAEEPISPEAINVTSPRMTAQLASLG